MSFGPFSPLIPVNAPLHSEKMMPQPGIADAVWQQVYKAAQQAAAQEPRLSGMLDDIVLSRTSLCNAVAVRLARKLSRHDIGRDELEPLIRTTLRNSPQTMDCIATDLRAVLERDAACNSILEPLLFFKGFQALATQRVSHLLWEQGRHLLALLFQSVSCEVFSIDIHPAAQIGCGIFMDHGTGIVVGETAIIENDVSMLHEVTLGGTGKVKGGARHPIVRSGVLLGAGAKVLGRIEIGEGAKVAASSVVLEDVRPHTTVAGVPAVEVCSCAVEAPAMYMQQSLTQE